MNNRLLIKLRKEAEERVGVFPNDGVKKYAVVLDLRIIPDLRDYSATSGHFRTLGTYNSLPDAIKSCDNFRRDVILRRVREIKYGNSNRFY